MADRGLKHAKLRLKGERRLMRAMDELRSPAVRRKIVRPAVRAGAKPIRNQIKANVPKGGRGHLRRSIKTVVKTAGRGKGNVYSVTGPENRRIVVRGDAFANRGLSSFMEARYGVKYVNPAKYAHIVENGSRPHTQKFGFMTVQHPGTKPTKFASRAYVRKARTSETIIRKRITVELHKEAKRSAKKAGSR